MVGTPFAGPGGGQTGRMGIRYYGYAFEADMTERALVDPHSILSSDPLADAWGLEPHAAISAIRPERAAPKRDFLDLDKAWSHLQWVTRPRNVESGWDEILRPPRPAHRMFEGRPTMTDRGHLPWVRALSPAEVREVAEDLATITDDDAAAIMRCQCQGYRDPDEEVPYAMPYLTRAREFVAGLVGTGRGMVYTIG